MAREENGVKRYVVRSVQFTRPSIRSGSCRIFGLRSRSLSKSSTRRSQRNRISFIEEEVPDGYQTMYQTMRQLNVSRQTVLQRVKRGEIKALHVQRGRQKGLRLKVLKPDNDLFNQPSADRA
jgi:hypothetical protein